HEEGSMMMDRLLIGTAVAAALAIAAPAWAQSTMNQNPSAAPTTPYTSGMPSATGSPSYAQPAPTQQTAPYAQQTAPYGQQAPGQAPAATAGTMPGTTAGAMPETSAGEGARATPRRHATRRHHGRQQTAHVSGSARRGGRMNDNIADQLNREEAGRLGAGMTGSSAAPTQMAPNQT